MAEQPATPADHASTTEPAVDYEKAITWVDRDKELLSELVDIFLQDCPARVQELREAISVGDAGWRYNKSSSKFKVSSLKF